MYLEDYLESRKYLESEVKDLFKALQDNKITKWGKIELANNLKILMNVASIWRI